MLHHCHFNVLDLSEQCLVNTLLHAQLRGASYVISLQLSWRSTQERSCQVTVLGVAFQEERYSTILW